MLEVTFETPTGEILENPGLDILKKLLQSPVPFLGEDVERGRHPDVAPVEKRTFLLRFLIWPQICSHTYRLTRDAWRSNECPI